MLLNSFSDYQLSTINSQLSTLNSQLSTSSPLRQQLRETLDNPGLPHARLAHQNQIVLPALQQDLQVHDFLFDDFPKACFFGANPTEAVLLL